MCCNTALTIKKTKQSHFVIEQQQNRKTNNTGHVCLSLFHLIKVTSNFTVCLKICNKIFRESCAPVAALSSRAPGTSDSHLFLNIHITRHVQMVLAW